MPSPIFRNTLKQCFSESHVFLRDASYQRMGGVSGCCESTSGDAPSCSGMHSRIVLFVSLYRRKLIFTQAAMINHRANQANRCLQRRTPNRGSSYLRVEILRQGATAQMVSFGRNWPLLAPGPSANYGLSRPEARGVLDSLWRPFWDHFRQLSPILAHVHYLT